jgi:hypothetical protein
MKHARQVSLLQLSGVAELTLRFLNYLRLKSIIKTNPKNMTNA